MCKGATPKPDQRINIHHGDNLRPLTPWVHVEFWDARIAAANPPLRQSEARIPERPDQTDFLRKWYDWHRGYRIIIHDDGREEHQSMIGERLQDVPPGHLPRTFDELRAASYSLPSMSNQTNTESPQFVEQSSTADLNPTQSEEEPIDPEDRIFDPAEIPTSTTLPSSTVLSTNTLSTTSLPIASPPIPSPPTPLQTTASSNTTSHAERARQAEYQARRVAALRRELSRMRSGIERVMSGLQELGESIPDSQDAVRRSANPDTRLQAVEERLTRPHGLTNVGGPSNLTANLGTRTSMQALQERLTSTHGLANVGASSNQTADLDTQTSMDLTPEPIPRLPSILDLVGNDPHMSMQQRLEAARDAEGWTRRQREHVAVRLEELESEAQAATERRRQLEHEIRLQEQNVFGSREEVEREGAEYESPIGGMFRRAYARYGDREEERRQEQLLQQILDLEADGLIMADDRVGEETNQPDRRRNDGPTSTRAAVPERALRAAETLASNNIETPDERRERFRSVGLTTLEQLRQQHIVRLGSDSSTPHSPELGRVAGRRYSHLLRRRAAAPFDPRDPELDMDDMDEDDSSENVEEEQSAGLDRNDGRPAPKSDEEMMVKSECKICYGQLATVAVLPCGGS